MKTLLVVALAGCMMIGCAESSQENKKEEAVAFAKAEETNVPVQEDYASFGAKISASNAMTQGQINEKYAQLKPGDTAVVKFEAPINAVCKSKGCWMRLDIAEEEKVFVKFKDYGFFVPLDTEGQ
ncbi:MAG: glucose/arabinose dehydrogenase, partial [Gammaproteobacteria bacterium]